MGYPRSAIVGQEEARLALCLLAVNPAVGGVLLIGGRGVGKSVLARGLKRFCTELWMQAGWTEVPVYINQEQLAGKNGILERAKSSWLYMDEINLLADQAGRTLAVEADCRGMIGTMDPEEGSLSEYLKERFGLTVFLELENAGAKARSSDPGSTETDAAGAGDRVRPCGSSGNDRRSRMCRKPCGTVSD